MYRSTFLPPIFGGKLLASRPALLYPWGKSILEEKVCVNNLYSSEELKEIIRHDISDVPIQ
jgi:hypothetical protein